jgi:hypothetical protein
MSRHGYVDDDVDQQQHAMWRGRLFSAIRGKRGQRLLRDLRDALDAMPDKRLIYGELVDPDGEVCALGCVGQKRQVADLDKLDPEDPDTLAKTFDVAEVLIREVEYENDDGGIGLNETPEERWERMRKWVEQHIAVTPAP